jgi:hypothetical protein
MINLKPPGIDIPSKLAFVMMELGLIPDALTLLTDVKKSFGSSYQAWLLYSDLMLRIGHECEKWHNGIQNACNPMLRRWLRKYSNVFDWNERRLQALSKALETACGSHACAPYIRWLKLRLLGENDDGKHQRESEDIDGTKFNKGNASGIDTTYEVEKQILLRRNKQELDSFDATTEELSLKANSLADIERSSTRSKLRQRHKDDLQTLLAEFEGTGSAETICRSNHSETENWDIELPLTASSRMVCFIASELLRHLLKMKLYDGGRFVSESVSNYLKERYALLTARKEKQRVVATEPWFSLEPSEEKNASNNLDDDSDQNSIILSDDEEFESINEPSFLHSLKNGILPPDLKVLYGLCLAGEGDKNFIAAQCFVDIDLLKQERRNWLSEMPVDTSVSVDYSWLMVIEQRTEPLERTAMYAFAADIIHEAQMKREFLMRIAPLFRRHIHRMKIAGMLDDIFTSAGSKNVSTNPRIPIVAKILIASACKSL